MLPNTPSITKSPKTYTTNQGDMFDKISYYLYGTEYYSDQLMYANPNYANVWEFDSGVVLNVPFITPPSLTPPAPPWVIISSSSSGL